MEYIRLRPGIYPNKSKGFSETIPSVPRSHDPDFPLTQDCFSNLVHLRIPGYLARDNPSPHQELMRDYASRKNLAKPMNMAQATFL